MASPILAGVTILMLGDSHFASQGYLVTTLQDALLRQGAKVVTVAACGAASSVWTESHMAPCGSAERIGSGPLRRNDARNATVPSFDDLVARYKPNLIVVGSGDAMGQYGQPVFNSDWVGLQVSSLTHRIQEANIACVWVGPGWATDGGPYFKTVAGVQRIDEFLSTHVAPCRYIDTTTFAKPGEWPTFDGQHYTQVGYAKWGRAIGEAIVHMAQSR